MWNCEKCVHNILRAVTHIQSPSKRFFPDSEIGWPKLSVTVNCLSISETEPFRETMYRVRPQDGPQKMEIK